MLYGIGASPHTFHSLQSLPGEHWDVVRHGGPCVGSAASFCTNMQEVKPSWSETRAALRMSFDVFAFARRKRRYTPGLCRICSYGAPDSTWSPGYAPASSVAQRSTLSRNGRIVGPMVRA